MAATAVDHEHRVTPRELFFDLVFVFAFTQVATLLTDDPTFAGIGRGVLVLAALWWTWSAYAWLTNTVDPEEAYRLGLVDHLVPADRFAEGVDELVTRYTALSPAAAPVSSA